MEFRKTKIDGVWIVEPRRFEDDRGSFMETYSAEQFGTAVGKVNFVQDNESVSRRGVLRGMHYQRDGWSQAKLVRVVRGRVLDVVVDMRSSSPDFGKYVAVELSGENGLQLFVPRGFAHGFLSLEDGTIFSYKVDNVWRNDAEESLKYDDPSVGIEWPDIGMDYIVSKKDMMARSFDEAYKFKYDLEG